MKKISILILTLFLISSCGSEKTSVSVETPTASGQVQENQSFQVEIETPLSPEKSVETFYKYLSEKKYKEAYALWDNAGKASGYSYEDFEKGYSSLQKAEYAISGEITLKNNLGIVSAEIPVEVTLTAKTGNILSYSGSYTALQSEIQTEAGSGQTLENAYWLLYSSNLELQK